MLEKREERIKLLKAGFNSKIIEMLYIKGNDLRIIGLPPVIELLDLDTPKDENNQIRYKAVAKCA